MMNQDIGKFDYANFVQPENFSEQRFVDEALTRVRDATAAELVAAENARKANADPRLSEFGQAETHREIAQQHESTVRDLEARADGVEARRQNMLANITEGLPDPTDPAVEVRQREIRDRLATMPKHEVIRMYQQAGEVGDVETIAAIERAPAVFRPLDDELIDRLRMDRLARKCPDIVQTARDQEALHSTLKNAAATLRRRLGLET